MQLKKVLGWKGVQLVPILRLRLAIDGVHMIARGMVQRDVGLVAKITTASHRVVELLNWAICGF